MAGNGLEFLSNINIVCLKAYTNKAVANTDHAMQTLIFPVVFWSQQILPVG